MELTLQTFLIVCPFLFLAGLVDAIGGGGGLISLPAYLLAGLPPHAAIATNKMSSTCGTTVATVRMIKKGLVNFKLAIPSVVFAVCGSSIGARLSLMVDDKIMTYVVVLILPVSAFLVMNRKLFNDEGTREVSMDKRTVLTALIAAFVIGMYDGFYGPGTGTFLMLLLTAVAHISLNEAAGTTKVINLSTNFAALAVFLVHGVVWFPLALVAAVFGIAGNYIGANYFTSKGTGFVKPVIIVVLTIFFIKICYELI